MTLLRFAALACGFACVVTPNAPAAESPRSNVVLILTDDQGYGDLSCHGNPALKTPHLDALHGESVRLTDYHVDPTCSPTRAALYTGRYSTKTGVWHTIQGRSLMDPDEVTLAEHLRAAGYRTGMIGKWHLGDAAPLRARDQGFHFTFTHGGGGVGQTPDVWGNDYFGDTYTRFARTAERPDGTEERVKVDGYCTDEWFAAADRFVTRNDPSKTGEPFFLTLATNAPHGPYLVPEEYAAPYKAAGVESPRAEFYGMIACIDARLGEFRARLEELGLAENTIFLFTTDNGTAAGHRNGGFNAGMRGAKGSAYEGGHRVPFFLHWPAGGFDEPRDVTGLTAHVDILPTLLDLCEVKPRPGPPRDGMSLRPFLEGRPGPDGRTLALHSQRVEVPEKWRKACVMKDRWRLVGRNDLFDLAADPGQTENVIGEHLDVAAELRAFYDRWWKTLEPAFDDPFGEDAVCAELGDVLVELTAHDWHEPVGGMVPWNQPAILKDPEVNGWWAVRVTEPGTYRFVLRDRPAAAMRKAVASGTAGVTVFTLGEGPGSSASETFTGSFDGPPAFTLPLPEGRFKLKTVLSDGAADRGAYYVTVERTGAAPPVAANAEELRRRIQERMRKQRERLNPPIRPRP